MQTYNRIFVGAGLANLAAARMIIDRGDQDLLILDSGRALLDRSCPGVKPQKCVFCSQGCSILSGIGGTNALFGNKMCYFPASPRILDFFAKEIVEQAWQWLDSTLPAWFSSANNRDERPPDALGLKHYESVIFSPADFHAMVHSLAGPLLRHQVIRVESEVASIERHKSRFVVTLRSGQRYSSSSVVLGTGRSGSRLMNDTCKRMGIPVSEPSPDVGFRVEAPRSLFSDFYNYQEDPKLKRSFPEGIARTFCAENGGVIVPVAFESQFFGEGAYPSTLGEYNNVALMVRTHASLSMGQLQDWCSAINAQQNGTLLTGEINVSGLRPSGVIRAISRFIPKLPSLQHDHLMLQLLRVLSSDSTPLFRRKNNVTSTVRVYAPAIDHYWPIPEVHYGLSTRIRGLHILGDAVGASRGYVQALTSGAAWALSNGEVLPHQIARGSSRCPVLV